jgi:hypothetical protein
VTTRAASLAIFVAAFAGPAGCTSVQLDSRSSSYPIVDSMSAAAGARSSDFQQSLQSDVATIVQRTVNGEVVDQTTIFEDVGRVTMRLAMRDPGSTAQPTMPTPANAITFRRYHVDYLRSDGRAVSGLDVPYAFDDEVTFSVTGDSSVVATFVLVRAQAKQEPPLRALRGGGGAQTISTIARVTFYGADQAGRPVSITAGIGVHFSDWLDPQ